MRIELLQHPGHVNRAHLAAVLEARRNWDDYEPVRMCPRPVVEQPRLRLRLARLSNDPRVIGAAYIATAFAVGVIAGVELVLAVRP